MVAVAGRAREACSTQPRPLPWRDHRGSEGHPRTRERRYDIGLPACPPRQVIRTRARPWGVSSMRMKAGPEQNDEGPRTNRPSWFGWRRVSGASNCSHEPCRGTYPGECEQSALAQRQAMRLLLERQRLSAHDAPRLVGGRLWLGKLRHRLSDICALSDQRLLQVRNVYIPR